MSTSLDSFETECCSSPARVVAPQGRLSPFALIRTVARNPIEAWPRAVYEEPLYRSSLFGRETVFVMDPDLIGEIQSMRQTLL